MPLTMQKNYMKTYREYKMVSRTFREYRFQRFVAYYLSELNSAKKNREDHSTIVTKSSFKLEKPLLQLGDLRQRLFCTYENTQ